MKGIQLREERGAATVEFAVIAGILFLIVFGIIEFGLLLFNQHILTNASREGARAGVVMRSPRLSDEKIRDEVKHYAQNHMVTFAPPNVDWPNGDDFSVSPATRVGNMFGQELTVTVKYEFDFLFFPWKPKLEATTRMRME
ncbi:TadE/TadG family type IV pilus assembly protein [Deltaproteobacteria bacterium IMCC39524]|nr:TadE/TadG family type IV pilus assembly protein [Deltaproteobacteria bacterium IMCC39524]